MDAKTSKALAAFGFLTVLHSPDHGWFGGYLVLSPQGRPLEFRCSTPVAATRAQEILYGQTLRPYLFADVIGQSLLASSELPVEVVLTDQPEMLSLALLRPEEVLCVELNPVREEQTTNDHVERGLSFALAGIRISAASTTSRDQAWFESMLKPLAAHVTLIEPFDRIRAALREAQAEHADERGDHGRAAA